MSIKLYMDVHVKRAVIDGLRRRGVDLLTAQNDGMSRLDDSDLLDRATSLARVLLSQDDDLLREAMKRQSILLGYLECSLSSASFDTFDGHGAIARMIATRAFSPGNAGNAAVSRLRSSV